jgi:tRNA G18 (ribose-2'-O)-methylase SpoU
VTAGIGHHRRVPRDHRPDVIEITDPADPRLADYFALTDVDLRTKFEPPAGLFIAEGELVIRRAVEAGYRLRSLLLSERWLPSVAAVTGDAPVYLASSELLEQVTGFHVHRGALASLHRRPLPELDALLASARRIAVLEHVNTHTNVGAIFRGAAGLGMDAVVLSPSCADPLYRRAVRVSMGEVFKVPYARLEPWPRGLARLREAGYRLLALTPGEGAVPLPEFRPAPGERLALLLGAEGPGLSPAALAAADTRVCIPMAAGVDSLNVAAAAAVAFYAVTTAR